MTVDQSQRLPATPTVSGSGFSLRCDLYRTRTPVQTALEAHPRPVSGVAGRFRPNGEFWPDLSRDGGERRNSVD